MKEATTLHFDLVEHAGERAVQIFVRWLYHRSLNGYHWTRLGSYIHSWNYYNAGELIESWRFGDYIQAPEFKNDVLRIFQKFVTKCDSSQDNIDFHPLRLLPSELNGLDTDSPVYRMLVAMLGQALYSLRNPTLVEVILGKLREDVYAAVTKYMVLHSAEIFKRLIEANDDGYILPEALDDRDNDLWEIMKGPDAICMDDFLEKIDREEV